MNKIDELRKIMEIEKVDALFIHQRENLLYLTGFSGSFGGALITFDNALIFVDSRYKEQATLECHGFEVVEVLRPWHIKKFLKNVKALGFEEEFLTVSIYEQLCVEVGEEISLRPFSQVLSKMRMIKTPEEMDIIQKAVDIADDAFHHILPYIKEGVMEIDIANELDFFMRSQGAKGPSFDFIVAGGVRSGLPHGVASRNKLQINEPILLDFGCIYQNYCSDISRTVFLGEPEAEMRQLYYVVKEGQSRACRKAFPGVKINAAEKAARDYFEQLELNEYFGHSLGHGVGLEIHEAPTVNGKNEDVFQEGMVFTIEPGIYIPDVGGIRIEDMVYMTKNGVYTLTGSPKDFIVLT